MHYLFICFILRQRMFQWREWPLIPQGEFSTLAPQMLYVYGMITLQRRNLKKKKRETIISKELGAREGAEVEGQVYVALFLYKKISENFADKMKIRKPRYLSDLSTC